jgi:hypothetical protein
MTLRGKAHSLGPTFNGFSDVVKITCALKAMEVRAAKVTE